MTFSPLSVLNNNNKKELICPLTVSTVYMDFGPARKVSGSTDSVQSQGRNSGLPFIEIRHFMGFNEVDLAPGHRLDNCFNETAINLFFFQ
jgi:hypothetical protein